MNRVVARKDSSRGGFTIPVMLKKCRMCVAKCQHVDVFETKHPLAGPLVSGAISAVVSYDSYEELRALNGN